MLITHKHLDDDIEYDGSQIEQSWAFRSFGIKGSTIVTWIGSMNISSENLKDFEDVGLEIKSDKMIHFIIEHFDQQPANLMLAYMRQRLFVIVLKEKLAENGIESIRVGDDIYINSNGLKKLTVSIATVSVSAMKIHLGINVFSDGTPDDIGTIGLFELNNNIGGSININDSTIEGVNDNNIFNDNNLLNFINDIVNGYVNELNDIELDISKTNLL